VAAANYNQPALLRRNGVYMLTLGYIFLATVAISLISLVGIFFIGMKTDRFENFIEHLVSFAVGGLLGGAFLHLLPEAMESRNPSIFSSVLSGIIVFFLVEKLLHWRHCHKGQCETLS
jgi:zinc and cadmium transporter